MEQYRLLAECLLPAHMLDWFDLKTVRVEKKGDTQGFTFISMRTSRNLTTEKTCAPMDLHAKVCFTTFRLEVRKFCFTCAVADGLMHMVARDALLLPPCTTVRMRSLTILSIALPMHQQNPSMQRSSISEHNSEVSLTVNSFSSD